jgi:hypothetical protein
MKNPTVSVAMLIPIFGTLKTAIIPVAHGHG